jgi:Circularly permutated YpsA SLOG family
MLEKIISGGQTGADQAAWRAARACSIATGGSMPKGFLTEDGTRPEFATLYDAREMPTAAYPPRTRQNARDSDATLWFGDPTTPGAHTTLSACRTLDRPTMLVIPGELTRPSHVADWITQNRISGLNIAGNRESKAPGIGQDVERFLIELFRQLGHRPE